MSPLLAHNGHGLVRCTCPLLTQSGHWGRNLLLFSIANVAWFCGQPCPPRRQLDRCKFFQRRGDRKATGIPARTGARSHSYRCARQSDRSRCLNNFERRSNGCRRNGIENPGLQRQHQPRDRRSLRYICARAARRASRRYRRDFKQPACPVGPSSDALCVPAAYSTRDFAEGPVG